MEAQNDTSLTFIAVVLATSQFAFFVKQSLDRLLTERLQCSDIPFDIGDP